MHVQYQLLQGSKAEVRVTLYPHTGTMLSCNKFQRANPFYNITNTVIAHYSLSTVAQW